MHRVRGGGSVLRAYKGVYKRASGTQAMLALAGENVPETEGLGSFK